MHMMNLWREQLEKKRGQHLPQNLQIKLRMWGFSSKTEIFLNRPSKSLGLLICQISLKEWEICFKQLMLKNHNTKAPYLDLSVQTITRSNPAEMKQTIIPTTTKKNLNQPHQNPHIKCTCYHKVLPGQQIK